MPSVIVVGTQWGDEGKGKVIDLLTSKAGHIVRSQGGNNAGHTIIIGNNEYKLHLTPSGILHPHTQCYIGAGTVIDPEVLVFEMTTLQSRGIDLKDRLWISPMAHVIFPYHRKLDLLLEKRKGPRAVGTTGRGIGPCYADKANRLGIRIADLMDPDAFSKLLRTILELKNDEIEKVYDSSPLSFEEIRSEYARYATVLQPYIAPVEDLVYEAVVRGDNVLFEGAQGTFLDTTLGTYPYVTSSSTIAGGICTGTGIGPTDIDHILGVIKAYTTRVGLGPLPSEVSDDEAFLDHFTAREFGTTTRRKRRIGWFDAVISRSAKQLNGLSSIALTKLDVLDKLDEIKICVAYEIDGKKVNKVPYLTEELERARPIYETMPGWKSDTSLCKTFDALPQKAKNYIDAIGNLTEAPVGMVSVGPEREQTIMLQDPFALKVTDR